MSASPTRKIRGLALASIAAAAVLALALVACREGMTGKYTSNTGLGALEFKGSKVYVTTVLGTTFVAEYEVDGNRVLVKGAGGTQVFTRKGNELDGGLGMKFVKE